MLHSSETQNECAGAKGRLKTGDRCLARPFVPLPNRFMEAPNKHFVILSKLFRRSFDLPPDSRHALWLSVSVQEKRNSESTGPVAVATYFAAVLFFGLALAARADELTAGPNDQIPTAPAQTEPDKKPEPFAFADFTWLNGNSRQHTPVIDTKAFTGELRVDTN